jgi:beta-lactamase regulating signal transducer with metallopeptidase domain
MTAVIALGAGAKVWLGTLAMMAVQGTLLAIVALALTRAGGRLRPAWQAALWLVVVVKFALPWGPGLRFSLSDLIASLVSSGQVAEVTSTLPPALQPLPPQPHLGPAVLWLALALVWAAGALAVVIRATVAHHRTVAAARAAELAPEAARALVAQLGAQLGVRAPVLRIGAPAIGPHVIGFLRATIVVPPALLAEPTLLRAALLHELAHVRRRDILGRTLQVAANALLWWWPVARLVGRRLDAARESACDAWALEAGDLARPTYARLLVRMAELRAAAAVSLAAPAALDARVAAVLGPSSHARTSGWQRAALAGWIVLALGGARTASAHPARTACRYTPQLALSLYASHPEADRDGDGQLSRDEACGLQAELRRRETETKSHLDPVLSRVDEAELESFLGEPLCCNCDPAEANSRPDVASCSKQLEPQ